MATVRGGGYIAYRILSGVLMLLCFVIGAALLRDFFLNIMAPASMTAGGGPRFTNYWGFYMMGFAGALLITWGGFLFAAVLRPTVARAIGTATAFGLIINAIFLIAAWFSGEYAEVGNLPRVEAAIMLALALGFIWLRPSRQANAVTQGG